MTTGTSGYVGVNCRGTFTQFSFPSSFKLYPSRQRYLRFNDRKVSPQKVKMAARQPPHPAVTSRPLLTMCWQVKKSKYNYFTKRSGNEGMPFLASTHFDITEIHSKSGGLPLCGAGRWSAILFTPVFHRSQVLEVQGLDNLFIFLFTTVFFSISLFRDSLSCPVLTGTMTYSRGTVIDNKVTASHTVCWTLVWQCYMAMPASGTWRWSEA